MMMKTVVSTDYLIEMIDIVQWSADWLHGRVAMLDFCDQPPPPAAPVCAALQLAYKSGLLESLKELQQVNKILTRRLNRSWAKRMPEMADANIYRLFEQAKAPPSAQVVDLYLLEVAKANDIQWKNAPGDLPNVLVGVPVERSAAAELQANLDKHRGGLYGGGGEGGGGGDGGEGGGGGERNDEPPVILPKPGGGGGEGGGAPMMDDDALAKRLAALNTPEGGGGGGSSHLFPDAELPEMPKWERSTDQEDPLAARLAALRDFDAAKKD